MRLRLTVLVVALAVASCGGDDDEGPSAQVTSPPTSERTTTTESLTPEQEVEAAYLRSWDVYAKAVRELDPSGLEESYAEEQLERTKADVTQLAGEGHAVLVRVEHNYTVRVLEDGLAVVVDEYRNHSVIADPETGEPREPDPNELILETYTLRRIENSWRVVDIARQS